MNLQISNVPLRERAEQNRLAVLFARIEAERAARSFALAVGRARKIATKR